jgi:hypothetical protein
MESTDYSYPLGTHMTETIRLAVDLEPDGIQSPADVDSYAVMLYYDREVGEEDVEQVQIARVDDVVGEFDILLAEGYIVPHIARGRPNPTGLPISPAAVYRFNEATRHGG